MSKRQRNEQPLTRLLLHAVDGVVPYLTPRLLHECFPPTSNDRFWVGMAVKDTCLYPVHKDGDDPRTSNPRGYTFQVPRDDDDDGGDDDDDDDSSQGGNIDAFMEPYTRLVVPTFDLIQDSHSKMQEKRPQQKQQEKQPPNGTADTAHTATDKNVMLWTPHGRQSITVESYYDACRHGLKNSTHLVSLFDAAPPATANSKMRRLQKRRDAATRRTREWWNQFWALACHQKDSAVADKVWIPFCVHDGLTAEALNAEITQTLKQAKEKQSSAAAAVKVGGVALVGWCDVRSSQERRELIATACKVHDSVAVLSTRSFRHVLECVLAGASVVGSALPQIWAQQKKAFLVDLMSDSNTKRQRQNNAEAEDKSVEQVVTAGVALSELDEDGCLPLVTNDDDKVSQHAWYRDKGPLVQGCQCLTCRTHSRAYVYHLVCAKELLAEMLLFIHNLHHLLQAIQRAQTAEADGLVDSLLKQLEQPNESVNESV